MIKKEANGRLVGSLSQNLIPEKDTQNAYKKNTHTMKVETKPQE